MDLHEKKAFLINEDESLNNLLVTRINTLGYITKQFKYDKNILNEIDKLRPELILFDYTIFGINGIKVLKSIRNITNAPIIIITKNDSKFDMLLAFDLGVDDYLRKPIDLDELIARIKAINRRYNNISSKDNNVLLINGLSLNFHEYTVIYKDKEIVMPPREFELLYYLANNRERYVAREELLSEVWGYEELVNSRTVDVHIRRLRDKISSIKSIEIVTVWGKGYKFVSRWDIKITYIKCKKAVNNKNMIY